MRNTLATEYMTEGMLWDRAFILIGRCMPLENLGAKDLEVSLNQLEAVLDEIKLRGKQLELLAPATPHQPDEAS